MDDIVLPVTKRGPRILFPWLFAVALLATQAIALAHELKHDLHQHDNATCVLHVYTKHSGHVAHGIAWHATPAPNAPPPALEIVTERSDPIRRYETRAPPFPASIDQVSVA